MSLWRKGWLWLAAGATLLLLAGCGPSSGPSGIPPATTTTLTTSGTATVTATTTTTAAPTTTFSTVFGKQMQKFAAKDELLCAVSAAMTSGTGLDDFAAAYPSRFFDVGIAEEHAVTFCSGMAQGGLRPVFAVYSTFL